MRLAGMTMLDEGPMTGDRMALIEAQWLPRPAHGRACYTPNLHPIKDVTDNGYDALQWVCLR